MKTHFFFFQIYKCNSNAYECNLSTIHPNPAPHKKLWNSLCKKFFKFILLKNIMAHQLNTFTWLYTHKVFFFFFKILEILGYLIVKTIIEKKRPYCIFYKLKAISMILTNNSPDRIFKRYHTSLGICHC